MMTGRIVPLERESIEDRSSTRVAGWINERPRAAGPPASELLVPAGHIDIAKLRAGLSAASSKAPLLFMLGHQPPPSLLSLLMDAARTDRRIYVLAQVGFGEGTLDPGLRELARARVLVRRTAEMPASSVLVGRGEGGVLWLGAHNAAPAWTLRLTARQGAALFNAFLHLFWHLASDEAFTTGKNLEFRSAKKRPFDVPLSADGAVKLRLSPAPLPWAGASTACGPADLPVSGAMKAFLTRPGAEHHAALAEHASAGCTVVSNDLDLPPLVLGPTERTTVVGAGSRSLHIDLDDAQATALLDMVNATVHAPIWRFHASSPLGTLTGKPVWLSGVREAAVPSEKQPLEAGRVAALELRQVPATEPRARPAPDPLAVSALVRWIVDPPRVPSGATDDKLVLAWRKLDEDTRKRLEASRTALDAAEQHAKGIGGKLRDLASALLGFDRSRSASRVELEDLACTTPSRSGPAGARQYLERLRDLEGRIKKLADEQREAERKEEERLEEERQRLEWERARKEKTAELERIKADLQRAKDEQERVEIAAREADEAHCEEADEAAKKDLYTRKRKRDDELKSKKKEVERHGGQVRLLEEELNRPFKLKAAERPAVPVSKAQAATGARFVPAAAPDDSGAIPGEALPDVGTLLAVKGQRYLVIETWEDLNAGEKESGRLSAKLVAVAEGK